MLSFWPSFSLLVFFLVIFLECRVIGGRVTLPLGSFLMVFCYGSIGAPLLALLFQQIPLLPDASANPAGTIAWLFGPPIEELAKALPVIVLAFLTRESRRLSIADLTLIGFASGAGFGFVEGNLNALVNGTLPSLQHLAAFGLQSQSGVVFFAGHPVSTALVGLAAGIGLRFLPPNFLYAWIPSAFVILWACFDHGIYNWKVLLAGDSSTLPEAHFVVEFLHLLTLNGQLQTWLLPIGLVGAQFFEAYLCSKAVGARRDLLLAREWRPWVVNEWLVALLRAPLGRAAFGQTLGYFRLRRAFYLATFEARRDQKDPTLSRHARSLEDRLKRERSMLFDPPPGTWLLPVPVLKAYAAQWLWRMRWVLVFAVLLLLVFMLDPAGLPEWLRQFLFGETFTIAVVTAGLAFAVWRIVLFARLPPPDPLAAEGAACAGYYTRALLLGCALVCGLFPTLTLLLGWKAFAPGAAFISGYLPGWIAQGGNLQTLLGLGTIGAAVAPDPRPAGEALRHEIAAGDERIRRLGSDIESEIGTGDSTAPGTPPPLKLDAFLETMAKLDAERDAQARRQLVLDEYARQAGESTVRDPAQVVRAVKDEFERLAGEVLDAAAKELDAIAALEQAYGRAWSEIMQDLDAHDALRRRLKTPLRLAWQAQNDIAWALRVVEATDECLLPMQLTLLPELHALATTANSERADMVAAGVERIRAAASEYGEADPFAFAAGTNQTDEDEAALLAEFASAVPAEAPKPFGQRAPQPNAPEHVPDGEPIASDETAPIQSRGQHHQEALEQLIDAPRSDQGYLDTIRHLELSDETLEQPIEPDTAAILPTAAPVAESAGEVEDLIDAIKRDSGYLAFKDPRTAQADDDRGPAAATDVSLDAGDGHAPAVDDAPDAADAADLQTPRVDEAAPAELEIAAAPEDLRAPGHADADELTSDDAPVSTSEQAVETPSLDEPDPSAYEIAAAPVELRVPEHADADELTSDDAPVTNEAGDVADPAELETMVTPEDLRTAEHIVDDEQVLNDTPASASEQAADATGDISEVPTPSVDGGGALTLDTADSFEANDAEGKEYSTAGTAQREVDEPTPEQDTDEAPADDVVTAGPVDEPASPFQAAETTTTAAETESLRDVARHTDTPAPEPAEELGTRAERVEPVKAEEPAAREAFATPASETLRAPEESPSKAEIRSSLFAKLFQSLRRQSADAAVKPAAGDRWQPKAEAPRTEPEREPSATMPSIDDRRDAPAPDKAEAEPKTPPAEIDAPTAAWLADLATPNADEEIATVGDASLEAIEWPALSKPAEHHVPEPALDVESPIDVADYVETPADELAGIDTVALDAAPIAVDALPSSTEAPEHDVTEQQPVESASAEHAPDETASVVVAQAVEPVADEVAVSEQPLDSTPAEDQTLDVVASDAAAQRDDAATVAPETAAPAPEAADEFSSKADRLSYLLAKLETAMQAKAAAEAARDQDNAKPVAPQADQSTPLAAEAAVAADAEPAASAGPTEQTAPADKPDEPVAVVQTPAAVVAPSDERPVTIDAVQMEPKAAVEHKEAGDAPLKPDRLSYLLTKLFEAAKRETPAHTPQEHTTADEAPPSEQSATDDASGEHILDLRVPDAGTAEQHGSNSIEFGLSRTEPTEAQPANLREPAPAELPVIEIAPPEIELARLPDVESDDAELPETQAPEPILPQPAVVSVESAPAPSSAPSQPVIRPRPAEPVARFGSRTRPPRPKAAPARTVEAKTAAPVQTAEVRDPEVRSAAPAPTAEMRDVAAKPVTPERAQEFVEGETPATMPRRDWKLGSPSPARGETPKAAESQSGDAGAAKKSETTFRVKTGSGALATVDAPIPGASASAEKMPGKYYGPRLAESDDETTANSPAQQRALSLADALTEYYAKAGQQQPPMHTTDRAALQRIIANGKLEAPRRRGAPWSTSGMSRRGDVALRLKPGAEQFVEFVPSTEIFGQVPHYYPRGVGKGSYATHIPAGHLEYFDLVTRQWAPVQRG